MIAFSKQSPDHMHSGFQIEAFTGGAVAHVNVLGVFADRLAEIAGQIGIDQNVMMAFAVMHAFFCWLHCHAMRDQIGRASCRERV